MSKSVALSDLIYREFGRETADPAEIGIANVTAVPTFITPEMQDSQLLEELIDPADVLVVATDDITVQRRLAALARVHNVPALVPGISEDARRGEVFVSLGPDAPCILCFDAFRGVDANLRGAPVLNIELAPTVDLAVGLCIGLIDPASDQAHLFERLRPRGPIPQLFRAFPPGAPEQLAPDDGRTEVLWRRNGPGCGGRPGPAGPVTRAQDDDPPPAGSPRLRSPWATRLVGGTTLLALAASAAAATYAISPSWLGGVRDWTSDQIAQFTAPGNPNIGTDQRAIERVVGAFARGDTAEIECPLMTPQMRRAVAGGPTLMDCEQARVRWVAAAPGKLRIRLNGDSAIVRASGGSGAAQYDLEGRGPVARGGYIGPLSMDLADRILSSLDALARRVLLALWSRFIRLSLLAQASTVGLLLYAAAWLSSRLGLAGLAHELADCAWLILSLVITAAVIRHIWRRFTQPARFRW